MLEKAEQELKWRETYNALGEIAYLVRFFFIRLTYIDAFLCLSAGYGAMVVVKITGLSQIEIFGFIKLAQFSWMATGLIFALIISILRHIRPDGNPIIILRGLISKNVFYPLTKDGAGAVKKWRPLDGRIDAAKRLRRRPNAL